MEFVPVMLVLSLDREDCELLLDSPRLAAGLQRQHRRRPLRETGGAAGLQHCRPTMFTTRSARERLTTNYLQLNINPVDEFAFFGEIKTKTGGAYRYSLKTFVSEISERGL